MKARIYLLSFLLVLFGTASCNVGPQPIAYGSDGCHFCSMTIVDRQHAAEFVTKKGKVHKFDSIECMLNQMKEEDTSQVALFLVNDYNDPGVFIDAAQAFYLISKDLPSPMGEFLSAFASNLEAHLAETGHPGEVYSWDELRQRFR